MTEKILILLFGVFVGALLNHRLAVARERRRDRQTRADSTANSKADRLRRFRSSVSAVRDSIASSADDKLVEAHQASIARVREECATILDDIANRDGFCLSRDTYLRTTRDQIECRDWSKKVPLTSPPARYELGRAGLRQPLEELIEYAKGA